MCLRNVSLLDFFFVSRFYPLFNQPNEKSLNVMFRVLMKKSARRVAKRNKKISPQKHKPKY